MSPLTEPTKLTLAKDFTWNETIWNPSMIQTALWLDASDASTITESGGAVSQWDDKSGNGRHATQGTASNRPSYQYAALNGKNVVSFNGLTQWFNNLGAFNAGHFVAIANSSVYKSYAGLFTGGTSELILDSSGSSVFQATTAYVNSSLNLSIAVNAPFIWGLNLGASRLADRMLGQEYNVQGPGRAWNGYCGELIVLSSPQGNEIKNKLEGYLAHKWGLTTNLPAGHPYKTVGPTP